MERKFKFDIGDWVYVIKFRSERAVESIEVNQFEIKTITIDGKNTEPIYHAESWHEERESNCLTGQEVKQKIKEYSDKLIERYCPDV